jgi:hypothetical protein
MLYRSRWWRYHHHAYACTTRNMIFGNNFFCYRSLAKLSWVVWPATCNNF